MGKVPTTLLPRRTTSLLTSSSSPCRPSTTTSATAAARAPPALHCSQVRHATEVARPRRPYHFTQLVQLSDGSTYTVRTTSPAALYKSTKDSRNHLLWQPSEKSLRNVEVDEAGKLAAFRERFGRGWDVAQAGPEEEQQPAAEAAPAARGAAGAKGSKKAEAAAAAKEEPAAPAEDPFDSLGDLISGYAAMQEQTKTGGMSAKDQARVEKSSKGGRKR
ncbi:hypothetical protein NKR23_g5076 [Pleurostoma richardsiae]|uniref:Ribosomal protein bL31m N-terminal domain-containing protein n=1 Tax=Pleurostoma richardsiae TaxID=41990 RepID=A0AA38RGL5_9PEZI|nr:hypothetical protein NKR23_g5076 [Pleurostoma richardsiae]